MHSKRIHSGCTQREHGRRKCDNASMHIASIKYGPAHPRDVDDIDERMPHDTMSASAVWANHGRSTTNCTGTPNAQHGRADERCAGTCRHGTSCAEFAA